jgi:hypothetical protein
MHARYLPLFSCAIHLIVLLLVEISNVRSTNTSITLILVIYYLHKRVHYVGYV